MTDMKETTDSRALNSNKDLGESRITECLSPQSSSNQNQETDDDFGSQDFVNQKTEDELDKLFATRYTMANELYAEVARGFPNQMIVYPWNRAEKRPLNFLYGLIDGQQRFWNEKASRESQWQNNWRNPDHINYKRPKRNPNANFDFNHISCSSKMSR
ncbi:unnamed protein product [Thelazia callipaeda]|uniref:Uncharacterized protein n=1 Tax=Thelazia callipaeda TaxID=103827 RepID=A0A0N5D7B7_THECL|nr:unnamed protein product [Thelazia callipaeda]